MTVHLDDFFSQQANFDHPIQTPIRKIETHISTVYLTGRYAYKIKKPVNFGFLDFSTLEQRCFFCNEELRLNRRFAPELYLDTVLLTDQGIISQAEADSLPLFGGGARHRWQECAVRMRQFDPDKVLSRLSAQGPLSEDLLLRLADKLGAFHLHAETVADDAPWGTPENVIEPMADNFSTLHGHLTRQRERLRALESWTWHERDRLAALLQWRRQRGDIRACHGDLHLDNITLIEGEPVPFDGIEFNDQFRWIDPVSDMSFLLMDLDARAQQHQANRLLNRWLQYTGDYAGVPLLNFYKTYRALVRAKIGGLRALQLTSSDAQRQWEKVLDYIALAEHYAYATPQPAVIIMQGLSGSGKSTLAHQLAQALDGIVISSDVERKRLAGMTLLERPANEADQRRLYSPQMSQRTYEQLLQQARNVLEAGRPVILDATYLRKVHRAPALELAEAFACPALVLSIDADPTLCAAQIRQRRAAGNDPSDASESVMRHQAEILERPDSDEPYLVVQPHAPLPVNTIKERLKLPINLA